MKNVLAFSLAALGLGLSAAATGADQMERAMQYYERQHYAMARDFFHFAARDGNPQAQEILGFMYAFGPDMYPGVARDPRAAAQWFDRAARSGRPVARYMACAITRRVQEAGPSPQYCFDWVAETGRPGPR